MNDVLPFARIIEVIEVVFLRGDGESDDPVRRVVAYHDRDGRLLAENDPCPNGVDCLPPEPKS